ncbi:hypothetical protein VSQ32_15590 [Lachnospiraceae bacterium KK002]
MKHILRKTRNALYESCNFLELMMALVVLAAILIACSSLGSSFLDYWNDRSSNAAFLTFVGHVFNILIGIEFLKMLCQPSEDTVLEVLIFLVARHMILDHTTVVENLITILSIGILFAIKKYINLPARKGSYGIFSGNSGSEPSGREPAPSSEDIQN